ncbi:hypothetical protein D9611_000750 [Ephemerocybe angulata]|uniref:Protein kinase domain-containing protein n=1 Tax=Ephemerocybe angulata TaxID=980116 RepID=A0A8H5F7M9_9AGAR|nr:hypothetical protein D9611_000750 [Tulosesus angulatus]
MTWLARDDHDAKLVAIKVRNPEHHSTLSLEEDSERLLPRDLMNSVLNIGTSSSSVPTVRARAPRDHFLAADPDGLHSCLVYEPAGLSVYTVLSDTGRRLRADLARKVARQTAETLADMHRRGWVHGDLTTGNILFRLDPQVQDWSDRDIFAYFGDPYVYGPPERQFVDCIDTYKLLDSYFLQEDIILADFKHSFKVRRPLPPGHPLCTLTHYMSPELRFDGRIGMPSDIWALACVIFEVRTGSPLFDECSGEEGAWKSVVRILGEPPEAWKGPEDWSLRSTNVPMGSSCMRSARRI